MNNCKSISRIKYYSAVTEKSLCCKVYIFKNLSLSIFSRISHKKLNTKSIIKTHKQEKLYKNCKIFHKRHKTIFCNDCYSM